MKENLMKSTMSYKQLCEMFEEEPKTNGGKRKRQMEQWNKLLNIEKLPNRNLYAVRKYTPSERNEMNVFNSLRSMIEPLLYKQLLIYAKDEKAYEFDMGELIYNFSLINQNYKTGRYNKEKIEGIIIDQSEKANVTLDYCDRLLQDDINDYYKEVDKLLRRAVIDVLTDMEDKRLIIVNKSFGKIIEQRLENGDIINRKVKMDKEELKLFLEYSTTLSKRKYKKDYNKLNYYEKKNIDILLNEKMNIKAHYDLYNIIINEVGIKQDIVGMNYTYKELDSGVNRESVNKINKSNQGDLRKIDVFVKELLTQLLIDKNNKLPLDTQQILC